MLNVALAVSLSQMSQAQGPGLFFSLPFEGQSTFPFCSSSSPKPTSVSAETRWEGTEMKSCRLFPGGPGSVAPVFPAPRSVLAAEGLRWVCAGLGVRCCRGRRSRLLASLWNSPLVRRMCFCSAVCFVYLGLSLFLRVFEGKDCISSLHLFCVSHS